MINLLEPVEEVTTPEAFVVEDFLHVSCLTSQEGLEIQIQGKLIYMTDTVSFHLKKERRSTSVPGVYEDIRR